MPALVTPVAWNLIFVTRGNTIDEVILYYRLLPLLTPPARKQRDDCLSSVITDTDLYLKVMQLLECARPMNVSIPTD
jgi:hypothetical protein